MSDGTKLGFSLHSDAESEYGNEGANLPDGIALGLNGQIPAAQNPLTMVDTLTHEFQASRNISEKEYFVTGAPLWVIR